MVTLDLPFPMGWESPFGPRAPTVPLRIPGSGRTGERGSPIGHRKSVKMVPC